MAGDQSEEKALPASPRKLREARRKGQVPRSKDLIGSASLVGCLGFLALGGSVITAGALAMITAAGDAAAGDFTLGLHIMWRAVWGAAWRALGPVYVLAPGLTFVISVVTLGGIPFAADPVAPKARNINPVEGLKRLFALRAGVELVKSVIKTLLIGLLLLAVLAGEVRSLLLAPACGLGCVLDVSHQVAVRLVSSVCALFLVAGLADVGLQRWLFLRDQRMSKTEVKRERKDLDGDPIIRKHRQRLMREAAQGPARLGLREATLLVHDGSSAAVGLRFRRGETPLPVVVCRGRDARAQAMLAEATRLRLASAEDAELVRKLIARTSVGDAIPQDTFRRAAALLTQAGLV